MKKVAIFVWRNVQFKLFLPIIQKMLKDKRLIPVLITTGIMNFGIKERQNYKKSFNPFHDKINVYYVDGFNEIATVMMSTGIDVLLLTSIELNALRIIKEKNIKVIYLQHSVDVVSVFPKIYSFDFFELIDGFLCFSRYWKDEMIKAIKLQFNPKNEELGEIESKIHIVGMPELDQVHSFDKYAILKKYQLPTDRKKIIFFDPVGDASSISNFFYKYYFCLHGPMKNKVLRVLRNLIMDIRISPKLLYSFPIFLFNIFKNKQRIPRYEVLFQRLKKYCNENNYLLICKSREKNNDPNFIKSGCDFFSYDLEYLPFTLLEMLFISDVYIGFSSTAIMEAVYCGLPAITFQIFPMDYQFAEYRANIFEYLADCLDTKGEWLNYPKINKIYYWNNGDIEFGQSIGNLTIDSQIRDNYITKFLGPKDGECSMRVIKTIEENYIRAKNQC